MKGWYKTSYGEKYEFISSVRIYLTIMDITELVIPDGVIDIYCFGNKLTKLYFPDSVIYIDCEGNYLTELIVPDRVKYIDCRNNRLTELIVPDHCQVKCDESCKVITRTMYCGAIPRSGYNRSNRLKAILK